MKPDAEKQQALLKRLARVEGQLRGVQKLIREGEDCEKILQQLTASRKALDKSFFEMIACLVEGCVLDEDGRAMSERVADVRDLLSRYA
ncbi:MAG: metal-sensing transcriptional repressor [Alcanivoracaceae bacterium]|jgi:CsoR family transcriptional regulator, copper-sensing transcriptional repressor